MSTPVLPFLRMNQRQAKPRTRGITEIRGPYYTPMGKRYLEDLLETMGGWVDGLKFAGGSFALMPRKALTELLALCHAHDVEVSTGGFIEHVLTLGPAAVRDYIDECKALGFDTIEVSCGFITIPPDDWVRLVKSVQDAGLKARPEIGIQFGAGGASEETELHAAGGRDLEWAIAMGRRFLDAGADMIMLESEGITENVERWRTDVPARVAQALGIEKVVFEAADPAVFTWYVRQFGPEVNLFIDHSQIVQLECLRSGLWGTAASWGRILTYKGGAR